MPPDPEEEVVFAAPALGLEVPSRLLCGFPLPLAVTVTNPNPGTTYHDVTPLLHLNAPSELELSIGRDGVEVWSSPGTSHRSAESSRYTLEAGEALRDLTDLSEFGLGLAPGRYQLVASLRGGVWCARAAPVELCLEAPRPRDAELAAE